MTSAPPLDRDRIAGLLEASAAMILAEVQALGPEARWVVQTRVWLQMGNTRRFSDPNG